MGQVFGKSMGEIEQPCPEEYEREEYEEIKHERRIEYTIRKYKPYIAAQLLTHNDGLFPLCSYGRGIRSGGSIVSPQNTTQEFLLPESTICTPHYAQDQEFMSITPIPISSKKAACKFEFEFEFDPERPSIWELRLPKKYTRVEDAPQPWDKRVVLTKVEGRTCAVAEVGRSHFTSCNRVYAMILAEEADRLWETVEKDGYTVSGDPFLVGGSRGPHDEIQIRIPVVYLNEEASTK